VELSPAGRLRAALAAVLAPAHAPELTLVHGWPDTWNGIGLVSAGMHRAGRDLQLIQYGAGHWRATFWVTGLAHSITGGSTYERQPWRAVQRAAWEVVGITLMTRDELPEEDDPEFRRLSRRIWGAHCSSAQSRRCSLC
jgi:hypothetical protein